MAQLAYSQGFGKAYAGQLADGKDFVVDAYEAGGALTHGLGVIRGADDGKVIIGAASGLLRGVVIRTHSLPSEGDIVATDMVSVLRRGRVFMEATGTVAAEDIAYIEITVGADQGKATNASDSGNNLRVGRFMTAGADGDLVEVEVNFV